jgi:hypothetical protein
MATVRSTHLPYKVPPWTVPIFRSAFESVSQVLITPHRLHQAFQLMRDARCSSAEIYKVCVTISSGLFARASSAFSSTGPILRSLPPLLHTSTLFAPCTTSSRSSQARALASYLSVCSTWLPLSALRRSFQMELYQVSTILQPVPDMTSLLGLSALSTSLQTDLCANPVILS